MGKRMMGQGPWQEKKGAAARITPCSSRRQSIHIVLPMFFLNLCVVKCCSVPEVRSAMDTGDAICCFFANSPKRQLALEEWVGKTLEGEHRTRLKSLCRTRMDRAA